MGSLERPFTCQRDGLTIRGRAYFPEGFASDRKYPVVIVSHGFMGKCGELLQGFCGHRLCGVWIWLLRRRMYGGGRDKK